jgi:hypothetical protein
MEMGLGIKSATKKVAAMRAPTRQMIAVQSNSICTKSAMAPFSEIKHMIRMKAFQVLGGVFRHSKGGTDAKISLHKACTEAVLTLIAYDLEDYPLFEVDRSDVTY